MSLIIRQITEEAKLLIRQFRALSIIGPRQCGKTILSKMLFHDKPYVSFENPATQIKAEKDIDRFLRQFKNGAILDEVQHIPDLFRYMQAILDEDRTRGQFILTGSNNFLLRENISQSLAGRVGYLQLLPLSYAELQKNFVDITLTDLIIKGGYPEIWVESLDGRKWMESYLQTYVQRDVRLIRNISNLTDFSRFVVMCANRAGQIVNKEEMGRSLGLDAKTIQAWLSVLESSYIIFTLSPWYNNLNKRTIKSPKLYFHDTGLLCYLLGLKEQTLKSHVMYGSIFENWIISEIKKNRFNTGISGGMYFFRDSAGNEVDLILEKEGTIIPVEIKSGEQLNTAMLKGLRYWNKLNFSNNGILLYAGLSNEFDNGIQLLNWQEVADVW